MLVDPKHHRAYVTRDYQQLIPGDPIALFQAAFMVIQPNVQVFDELVAIIKKGNFLPATGWAGLGYGRRVGAMATQIPPTTTSGWSNPTYENKKRILRFANAHIVNGRKFKLWNRRWPPNQQGYFWTCYLGGR